jgi:hypothetical protein
LEIDIRKIENNVLGSLAVENIIPSMSGQKITRQFLQRKITSNQAISRILKLYGVRA